MNSFYSKKELKELGLHSYGEDVQISRKCSIYGAENINIENHVRIDDFCILSGKITIGNHVHISAYTGLYGGSAGIVIEDFVSISSRNAVYAVSDDYSGEGMANPTIPDKYRKVIQASVTISRHVLIGSGCTILPGVIVKEGSSVGAMSLINKSLEPWGMYAGIPCRRLKDRDKKLLELEKQYLREQNE